MNPTLTQEQSAALEANNGAPLRLKHPHTEETYVLLRAEIYDRWRNLLLDDYQTPDAYQAINEAFAAGWDDPKMADYDRYEDFEK